MQNTYLIDTFLSAWAWLILAMLYPSVINLTQKLNANMDKTTFQAVFSMVLKPSLLLAFPFIGVFLFLLWRFGSLMCDTQTFGVGGIGLLIIMGVAGITLIWLKSLLTLMTQGLFNPPKSPNLPKDEYDEYGRRLS